MRTVNILSSLDCACQLCCFRFLQTSVDTIAAPRSCTCNRQSQDCTHACTQALEHTHTGTRAHTQTHTHRHTHTHTDTHTQTHARTHAHTHTHQTKLTIVPAPAPSNKLCQPHASDSPPPISSVLVGFFLPVILIQSLPQVDIPAMTEPPICEKASSNLPLL